MDIGGKVVLVTGGARGIGRAIAERFLLQNAKGVSIIDFHEENGKRSERELQQQFGEDKVIFIHCDVSSKADLEDSFRKTKENFGRLDIVVNNAGISDEFNWEKMVNINLNAVIRSTYLAVEYMGIKHGGDGGVVINTASTLAFTSSATIPVYTATKYAIVGFVRSVSKEQMVVENNVRVTALCPAKVDTKLLTDCLASGSRYSNEHKAILDAQEDVPMQYITDAVIRLIEDASLNGASCAVRPNKPFYVIAEPTSI
ncbi:15-hydroxyprostaglandin dehydrogenase [NAD(+)]-like [Glandiceps talaboti]